MFELYEKITISAIRLRLVNLTNLVGLNWLFAYYERFTCESGVNLTGYLKLSLILFIVYLKIRCSGKAD